MVRRDVDNVDSRSPSLVSSPTLTNSRMARARTLASLATTSAKQAQGKAALLVHGAGGGGWEYDLWREAFERRGWRVVARDLEPGASGLAATSADDYVGQLAQWQENRTTQNPIINNLLYERTH